jgi:hypothetical protein
MLLTTPLERHARGAIVIRKAASHSPRERAASLLSTALRLKNVQLFARRIHALLPEHHGRAHLDATGRGTSIAALRDTLLEGGFMPKDVQRGGEAEPDGPRKHPTRDDTPESSREGL